MSATIAGAVVALIAQAKQKANEIFKVYSDIDEVFITSDLQGFTEKERAENHTDYLADKRIYGFQRNSDFEDGTPNEDGGEPSEDGDPKPHTNEPKENSEQPAAENNEERTALFAEYEQLFGQKPPHNIGIEELRAKINEKKQAG